jgi:hypothetical protein
MSSSRDLANHLAVQEVCMASNALEAHRRFERNIGLLKDWQIVYADLGNAGSLKLLDLPLGESGVATSVFRGKSLWIMDAPFVASARSGPAEFQCGSAMFIDSNAATYIRALAYQIDPRGSLSAAAFINQLGTRLQQLNPFLYLWEAQRHWTEETISKCKESVAAVHALSASGSRLTSEWGDRFRTDFRERAENFAEGFVNEFQRDLDAGLSEAIAGELELMEAILVRTQIIELSSNKSRQHKLASLVAYMHGTISTMMLRELVVCGEILLRSEGSRLAKKLNSIQNNPNPQALLKNCAWDLFIPRALDALCAATPDQAPHIDFYMAEVLTFDGDVCDITRATKLRAIAVHRPTKTNYPFFDSDVVEWLGGHIGEKRMIELEECFQPTGFLSRANRRSRETVRRVLEEDRAQLLHLIKSRAK